MFYGITTSKYYFIKASKMDYIVMMKIKINILLPIYDK
jgi:hypothetical protein